MRFFLQNMRNMLRSHDRYKPVSLSSGSNSTWVKYRAVWQG